LLKQCLKAEQNTFINAEALLNIGHSNNSINSSDKMLAVKNKITTVNNRMTQENIISETAE